MNGDFSSLLNYSTDPRDVYLTFDRSGTPKLSEKEPSEKHSKIAAYVMTGVIAKLEHKKFELPMSLKSAEKNKIEALTSTVFEHIHESYAESADKNDIKKIPNSIGTKAHLLGDSVFTNHILQTQLNRGISNTITADWWRLFQNKNVSFFAGEKPIKGIDDVALAMELLVAKYNDIQAIDEFRKLTKEVIPSQENLNECIEKLRESDNNIIQGLLHTMSACAQQPMFPVSMAAKDLLKDIFEPHRIQKKERDVRVIFYDNSIKIEQHIVFHAKKDDSQNEPTIINAVVKMEKASDSKTYWQNVTISFHNVEGPNSEKCNKIIKKHKFL